MSQRRDCNWVDSIQDDDGTWYMEEEDVTDVIIEFFKEIFTFDDVVGVDEAVEVVRGKVII